ncbi:hypothetical protein BpHYR1_028229 [Brachionus plicatilis]|uniref:Uncharacterized protein n=1 Tax=Brachionus plicatilis TaxID=10195 RepID=A0A3M7R618_BRAPC|nr:hypothetical protein BpHYR1_028229 [Brachionus plicatilis]
MFTFSILKRATDGDFNSFIVTRKDSEKYSVFYFKQQIGNPLVKSAIAILLKKKGNFSCLK